MSWTPEQLVSGLCDQICWARRKLCRAQKDEVYTDEMAWTGYLNALHWVKEYLLDPDVPAFCRGPLATTPDEDEE